jgi:hypothetical protein
MILFLIDIFTYAPPLFIKVTNPLEQREIDDFNIFKADLFSWKVGVNLDNNINLIISLTLLLLSVAFFFVGGHSL